MQQVREAVRGNPVLHRAALRAIRLRDRVTGRTPMAGFATLSPDVLPALVRCFELHREAEAESPGTGLLDHAGYYEFGLYQGFSFWFAEQLSRQYTGRAFRHYGFDSFAGLPQPQLELEAAMFAKGDFAGSYELVTGNLDQWKADPTRYRLFEGFYSDELFARFARSEEFPPVSLALIDVDLYESTVPVLTFLQPRLVPGSLLLFDDYNQAGELDEAGERRALAEFRARHPEIELEHRFDYGWEGSVFQVTAIG